MKGNVLKLAAGIGITCLFLFLAYRSLGHLNFARLIHYPVHYFYVLLSVIAFGASQWFRALSWSRGMATAIPLRHMFASVCMGTGANMLLPFRIGEIVRIVTAGRAVKQYGTISVNLVLERLLDVFILALFAVSVAFFIPFEVEVQEKLRLIRDMLLAGMVVGSIGLILAMRFRQVWITSTRLPGILRKIFLLLEQVMFLQSPLAGIRTLFYLGCSWGCVYLSAVAGLTAVGIQGHVVWIASLVVIVMTNLIMLIPSAPGGIGVFQYACVYSLSLFAIPAFQVAILSVLLHLVQYAAILPLSGYYFVRDGFSVREMYRSAIRQQGKTGA
ncbi:lysylphosphatidylglycerol synthase-like protein [Aneurinibacillus soli]|uniref:Phosphatidylglycerol lysyltransferase n=1 Tax=Aneurinibacillus soli TaxID=1500254 RepID=A0A0U4WNW8_9BACL|nr:lysylphosphatidylglycerol synthase transmembrane domain-containing protein [Aneurinibacillus soli]PYE58034.1 lysylphosphatidylglycerol synthase-like protein [Aneurinibacillus soli]BAU29912.1 hypothetical protein CB4_04184 [Aneurinibacillus soli]